MSRATGTSAVHVGFVEERISAVPSKFARMERHSCLTLRLFLFRGHTTVECRSLAAPQKLIPRNLSLLTNFQLLRNLDSSLFAVENSALICDLRRVSLLRLLPLTHSPGLAGSMCRGGPSVEEQHLSSDRRSLHSGIDFLPMSCLVRQKSIRARPRRHS